MSIIKVKELFGYLVGEGEVFMQSKAVIRAKDKYRKKTYANLCIVLRKEEREVLRQFMKQLGYTNVSLFVRDAIKAFVAENDLGNV